MTSPKRIVVVGSGSCGLVAIKCVKEEGMEPICFERTGTHGGLWHYHDDDVDGLASVMKTTIINTSKEIESLSDFPMPKEFPNYLHNSQVFHYLEMYAKEFDLIRHITYNKEVVKIDLAENYEDTGRLTVTVKDTKNGDISTDNYDGVMVCIGQYVFPHVPEFPHMKSFKGKIMHAHGLKKVEKFSDKRVVVVGVGNSGIDAAVEISNVSKQVYLSSRRGVWVLPRVGLTGLPFDLLLFRRWIFLLFRYFPHKIICALSEFVLNLRFNHDLYNLKPQHRIWSQNPSTSDALPVKLLIGIIVVRGSIERFTENGVIFDGEDTVTEVDAVVLATGYQIKFPFFNENILSVNENEIHLYKYIFPQHLQHSTLAILGLIKPFGPLFPTVEAQCRWTALVMNDKLKLPSKEEMEADIRFKNEVNAKRYVKRERHVAQVNYMEYLDEISSQFGAKPNSLKMLLTDPVLFKACMIGPLLSYQYRLRGLHSWPGARGAILSYKERVITPLKKNYRKKQEGISVMKVVFLFCVIWFLLTILNEI